MRKIDITRRQSLSLRALTSNEIIIRKRGMTISISQLPEQALLLAILDQEKDNKEWENMIITDGTKERWLKTVAYLSEMKDEGGDEVTYFMPQEKMYIGGTHDNL